MNYGQFLAFIVYGFSVIIAGTGIQHFIHNTQDGYLNRSVYLAETFLLGAILLIGEMLLLSLAGLYKAPFLWGAVLLQYGFVFSAPVRKSLSNHVFKKITIDFPNFLFLALLGWFFFRNCFPLVTGDSHNIYLFVQKMWLERGSSLVGDVANNIGIFTPHFNAVPYALGISLFGQETLFPQLINFSWRVIILLLVFGYTSYRFNKHYGIIAAVLVLFDEHFFYSGISACVVINGAVIAFLFSGIINFLEARRQNNVYRFTLGLLFAGQLMANKYQMAYILFFIVAAGFTVQPNLTEKIKTVFRQKRLLAALCASVLVTSLWYIKNFIVTGCPSFPVLAGRMGVFNWTPEMIQNFSKVFCVLSPVKFLKYFSYFWVWHGILPAKLLSFVVFGLPLIILISVLRSDIERETMIELGYWLGLCALGLAGVCLVCFCDPRIYRYLLPLFSFSFVYSLVYILQKCFGLDKRIIFGKGGLILCLLFLSATVYLKKQIPCQAAGIKDNIAVLLDKIHARDVMREYYPKNLEALKAIEANQEKFDHAAWDIGRSGVNPFSAFWLPARPQVGLWCTTVVQWQSYGKKELVLEDLKNYGLQWMISGEADGVRFLSLEEYAEKVSRQQRFPDTVYYDYGFPKELGAIEHQ